MHQRLRRPGRAALLATALLGLAGCETVNSLNPFRSSGPPPGTPGFVRGFLGGIAADDPAAALAGRTVLAAGGSAVDAAVAAGFTMAVTLPSRAGLGGGGACLVFSSRRGTTEAVLFPAGARNTLAPNADRPAAVPMLARGLFAVHTRDGRRPFEELMAPAEQAARFGIEVGRGLAEDIAAVARPLFEDPNAKAIFASPSGQPKAAGEQLVQAELAATLGALRTAGVGDLHQGSLARRLVDAAAAAGGGLTLEELRGGLPTVGAPIEQPGRGGDTIAFLPPPADGGLAAAAAFIALRAGQSPHEAQARGLSVVSAYRAVGGDWAPLLNAQHPPHHSLDNLGASSSLIVYDRDGGAVSCAFSLNNLFGTGRVAPGMGFVLGMAPNTGHVHPPLLSAAIAYNRNLRSFRAAFAGSGQQAAPMAVAGPAVLNLMNNVAPGDALAAGVPPEGRGNIGACLRYLPGSSNLCATAADPRGAGVALGTVDR